jgi:DnaA family protein
MAEQIPLHFAFNPELSFERFLPGSNAEVVQHLRAGVREGGEPLVFLWGESGSGKSHLLNACCREAAQVSRSISYLPLALLADYGPVMLEGLDDQDLVCLDDLDAVVGRDEWEAALFTLFNELRSHQRTLVVSANQPPGQLPVALPDLKTRFGWGLTLRLQPMNDADRLSLLDLHAHSLGLELSPRVGQFLLNHYQRDVQNLRILLDELDQATLAAKRKLTIPFLKTYLENRS